MMLDYFLVVVLIHFVYMVRKYLIDQYCKSEVFGLYRIVDDFDYKIPHLLMGNNELCNKGNDL